MVKIDLIANEDELYEYEIIRGEMVFRIGCDLHHFDDLLLLMAVDVEGPGQHQLGRKIHNVLDEVCRAFCALYKVNRILILGAKRTTGKTINTFFRPIYKKYD